MDFRYTRWRVAKTRLYPSPPFYHRVSTLVAPVFRRVRAILATAKCRSEDAVLAGQAGCVVVVFWRDLLCFCSRLCSPLMRSWLMSNDGSMPCGFAYDGFMPADGHGRRSISAFVVLWYYVFANIFKKLKSLRKPFDFPSRRPRSI